MIDVKVDKGKKETSLAEIALVRPDFKDYKSYHDTGFCSDRAGK